MRDRAASPGLLELLIDHGGSDDIYRLADDLAFEIDDLLPIVDAAQLLGFLKVEEGDAVISQQPARDSPNSEILQQKQLFRDAALETFCCCVRFSRALDTKCDHSIHEDFFLDMLDEQFSEEETQRQMETAVNWGRYSELFDFDAARRRFIMPEHGEEAKPRTRPESEKLQHTFALACHWTAHGRFHRSQRGRVRAGGASMARQHRQLLAR